MMSSIEQIKNDLESDDIFALAYGKGGGARRQHPLSPSNGGPPLPDDEWLNTTSEVDVIEEEKEFDSDIEQIREM